VIFQMNVAAPISRRRQQAPEAEHPESRQADVEYLLPGHMGMVTGKANGRRT
jgi:hypothetical protein